MLVPMRASVQQTLACTETSSPLVLTSPSTQVHVAQYDIAHPHRIATLNLLKFFTFLTPLHGTPSFPPAHSHAQNGAPGDTSHTIHPATRSSASAHRTRDDSDQGACQTIERLARIHLLTRTPRRPPARAPPRHFRTTRLQNSVTNLQNMSPGHRSRQFAAGVPRSHAPCTRRAGCARKDRVDSSSPCSEHSPDTAL